MDVKERNWRYFTNHLRDWRGIWTRYTPSGSIKESFQSLRSFKSNTDKTEITHTNCYMYANGETKQDSWKFNYLSNSLESGLFHPLVETMRGFFFASGHGVLATMQLKPGSYFGIELYFRYLELRNSVGIVYDDKGNLFHTANIREDSKGFPSSYWSIELNQVSKRDFGGNWHGTSVTITADLKISDPVPTELNWYRKEHTSYYLPDGVSVSCPSAINVGTPFTLIANWLVDHSQMHQLTANYNELGAFASLTLELFEKGI